MALTLNNNLLSANVARNLNTHYGRLATSTRRLSTGLRINSSADDAAGLAIRELQRADIAALNQGARNANDAISLIQTADGALGVIDEKLIRMKELAEQAATGTYNSTQRLMIESEYQAMASEITRIANATDFNGIRLLDGSLDGPHDGSRLAPSGRLKVHFGSGNDSAEDYYYLEIGECTSAALGIGNASTWQDVQQRAVTAFRESLQRQIVASALDADDRAKLIAAVDRNAGIFNDAITKAIDPHNAWDLWFAATGEGFMPEGKDEASIAGLIDSYLLPVREESRRLMDGLLATIRDNAPVLGESDTIGRPKGTCTYDWDDDYLAKVKTAYRAYADANGLDRVIVRDQVDIALGTYPCPPNKNRDRFKVAVDGACDVVCHDEKLKAEIDHVAYKNVSARLDEFWNGLRETERQKLLYAWGQAAIYNLANADKGRVPASYGIGMAADFDFGNDIGDPTQAATMLEQALDDVYQKIGHMDFAGYTIETQEDAQRALVAINDAIVGKDKVRSHLGAMQNRLENTVTNLSIQAENLQAAESRISDVDVATEMTSFVRNQILAQSAVAMLSQANSLPQMAMQLIGG